MSEYPDVFDYEELMEIADRNGLCPNCFHTLACCNGFCPVAFDMTHACVPNEEAARVLGEEG